MKPIVFKNQLRETPVFTSICNLCQHINSCMNVCPDYKPKSSLLTAQETFNKNSVEELSAKEKCECDDTHGWNRTGHISNGRCIAVVCNNCGKSTKEQPPIEPKCEASKQDKDGNPFWVKPIEDIPSISLGACGSSTPRDKFTMNSERYQKTGVPKFCKCLDGGYHPMICSKCGLQRKGEVKLPEKIIVQWDSNKRNVSNDKLAETLNAIIDYLKERER
jgi:hypothetical protein